MHLNARCQKKKFFHFLSLWKIAERVEQHRWKIAERVEQHRWKIAERVM